MEIILIILAIVVVITCAIQQVFLSKIVLLREATTTDRGNLNRSLVIKNTIRCAGVKIAIIIGAYVLMQFVKESFQTEGWIALVVLLVGVKLFFYEVANEQPSDAYWKNLGHIALMFAGAMMMLSGFIVLSCFLSVGRW